MPRVVLRAITPKKKEILDSKVVQQMMKEEGLDDAKSVLKRMAKRTVTTWSDKPTFRTRNVFTNEFIAVDLTPSKNAPGQRWIWINEGTRRRVIRPRRAGGRLYFRDKFIPKTRRGLIGSMRGYKGGRLISKRQVTHEIKARRWTATMVKQYRKRYLKKMNNAMRRAARASQA